MTTIDKLIATYTGCDIDLRTQMATDPRPTELLWRTGHSLKRTEAERRQHVWILHQAATKIDASVDPEPGQPLPELNPLGELQGHGGRVDLLIARPTSRSKHSAACSPSPAGDSPVAGSQTNRVAVPAGTRPRG